MRFHDAVPAAHRLHGLFGDEWSAVAHLWVEGPDGFWRIGRGRASSAVRSDGDRLRLRAAGDAPARHVAYLTDRVAMNEGGPQTYGTQIRDVSDGEGVPWPIADPQQLDERRARVGLPAFAEYVARWRAMT